MMDERPRLRVCILQRYLPPDPSGAGKLAITLAQHLIEMGHEVFLLGDRPRDSFTSAGAPAVPIRWVKSVSAQPSRLEILAYWFRLALALLKRRNQFDVLHVHAVNLFHAGVIPVARLLGKPVLVRASLEGDLPKPSRSRSEWIHYQCLRFANAFVVISRRLMGEYRDSGIPDAKLTLIPNGVDTEQYAPVSETRSRALRQQLGLPTDATILTYHGVFVERKSIHWVLPLLENLLTGTDLLLLLIGCAGRDEVESGYYSRLRQQISRSPARNSVVVTGFKKDVHRYLQASDLYLLPSTGEGLPNALLEAMAVGLIPIVSRTSGAEEVIEPGKSGFLFDPRDEAAFARCLEQALGAVNTDRGAAISNAAIQRVRSNYSIETMSKQYSETYCSIAEEY